MATENQKQFVADIESAVAAIKLKNPNHPPERLTINEVCELAGRSSVEMRALVLRVAAKPEDTHLLRRLLQAFQSVGLCPQYLAQSIAENEPIRRSALEPEPIKFTAPAPVPKLITTQGQAIEMPAARQSVAVASPGEVMTRVIKELENLPEKQQRRVIVSVSAYFGIGE